MIVRVAVVADSHFDEHSRFEECIRLHDWIAEDIARRDVAAVVHCGDVYERKSTPRERDAVAAWVQKVTEGAPIVIVRGNHDAVDDLPLLERLETRHPVTVEQAAGLHQVGPVNVVAVAWPRKAALLAAAEVDGHELGELVAGDALRSVMRGLGNELAECQGPRLLAMHAMVRGSITSTGQPLVGCDLELGLEDLALVRADSYALGHIHKGQQWQIDECPVVYPGSPRRTAFGELEAKGYTLIEWDEESGAARTTFVEAPATGMVHLDGSYSEGTLYSCYLPHLVRGAEVRFRYTVSPEHREAAKLQADELRAELEAAGAILVKIEEIVRTETRARAAEVAKAVTMADKLDRFWEAQNRDPGDHRAALLEKLTALDEETRNAA